MIDKITQASLKVPGLVLLAVTAVLGIGVYQYFHSSTSWRMGYNQP